MSTKIKGHRIDDKAIENKHLSDNFELREGTKVILNHPTHDNATDLTLSQYQILTQGGNADAYHYHTGGGGGAEGIYTHPQIDAALLRIMMELNSIKYGIDHSIVDLFDDDSGVDYGMLPAIVEEVKEIVSTEATSIEPEKVYSYMVAAKVGQGWTGLSSIKRLRTEPNLTGDYKKNLVTIKLNPGTTALKIFRCKSEMNFIYSSERKADCLYSPEGMEYEVVAREKTSLEDNALRLSILNATTSLIKDIASINDGANWVGKYILGTIYQGNDVLPVYCFLNPNPTNKPGQLVLQWSSNPAYVPLDYMVQYTTETIPDENNDTHWHDISDLRILNDFTPVEQVTNGVITNGKVVGNTRSINKFSFKVIPGFTGMRVIVTRQISGCMLSGINVYYRTDSAGQKVYQDLDAVVDITGYKALAVEINPGKLSPDSLSLGLIDENDSGAIGSSVAVWNNTPNTTTISGNPTRTLRETMYLGSPNYAGYNKIRLRFRYHSGSVKLTDVTIALTTVHNDANINLPQTIKRVTFNNGQLFYQGTDTYILSDWIHLDFPVSNFTNITASYCLESGVLYYHNNANRYTWYKDGYVGPCSYDLTSDGWVTLNNDYGAVDYVEIGKGYAVVYPQRIPENNYEKPFKHFIDIKNIASTISRLKRLSYMTKKSDVNDYYDIGDFKFCNVVDVLREAGTLVAVNSTSTATTAGSEPSRTCDGDNLTSCWESLYVPTIVKPENIMYKFASEQLVDKIRILQNSGVNWALENYKIQYTLDPTAMVSDAHDDIKWADVPGLRFSHYMETEFTGSINGGNVTYNNFFNRYLDHECTPFNATAIRILVFKTRDNTPVRIQDVQVLTADELSEFELIADMTNNFTDPTYFYEDGGAAGVIVSKPDLPKRNTSGSYNILYDKQMGYVRVLDKREPGVLITADIDAELMLHFMLSTQEVCPTPSDRVEYFMSNNGGLTWTPVTKSDTVQSLGTPGSLIKVKFVLYGDVKLSAYSVLYSL